MQRRNCQLINVPVFTDARGCLAAVDGLPFDPKRFYYIYNVAEAASRGRHAHKSEEELIFALAGSFRVRVSDGITTTEFCLDRPDRALYVPSLIWHELYDFAAGSVCAVLASQSYNPDDYYQVYEQFLRDAGVQD